MCRFSAMTFSWQAAAYPFDRQVKGREKQKN
ncbi:hypothetical protein M2399_002357 [Pseudomonas sp. BIGb0450]|nr:hypothetical protein [Pseudomonas sp. BIGb0558]MCS3436923.1 hypothetical protein [Pseudomonas sp. BIGb0450]